MPTNPPSPDRAFTIGDLVQYDTTGFRGQRDGAVLSPLRITGRSSDGEGFVGRYDPPMEGEEAWRNELSWTIYPAQFWCYKRLSEETDHA